MSLHRIAVAQLGARMHYAVPRALHSMGLLEQLHTDICISKSWPSMIRYFPNRALPQSVNRMRDRVPMGIPVDRIKAYNTIGIRYAYRRLRSAGSEGMCAAGVWVGQKFCEAIVRAGLGRATAVYGFKSAALELFQHARQHGVYTVLEQPSAPAAIERELMAEELSHYGDWQSARPYGPHSVALQHREEAEWNCADLILCASEFVRVNLIARGVAPSKCLVVPYGVDPSGSQQNRDSGERRKLRVLSLGSVGLMKGVQYTFEAAKSLCNIAEFRMVGPINLKTSYARELARYIDLTGPVRRSEVDQHYSWADVFLIPSLCEGSATVCYEALARGLPVIATTNTGSVIRDGIEGFVIPIRDSHAIIAMLTRIANSRALLANMRQAAKELASQYTVELYGDRLISALRGVQ